MATKPKAGPGITSETAAEPEAAGVAEEAQPPGFFISEGVRVDLEIHGRAVDPATGALLVRDKDTGTVTATDRATGTVTVAVDPAGRADG